MEAFGEQLRSDRQAYRNLSRPATGRISRDHVRGRRRSHRPHHVGSSDGARLRKALQQKGQTEEVVWMAVRQIDRPQRSALGLYPVGQLCCLRVAEKRIDQQRIMLTPDEGEGVRTPG